MYNRQPVTGSLSAALVMLELVYHNTARGIRQTHGNAVIAVLSSILQTILFVAVFYVMFSAFGLRSSAIRGDFILFLMSGVFLFMVQIKTIAAVFSSEGPTSPMMQHLPMTTAIAIASSALGALYVQCLTVTVVLGIYHLGWGPITILNPGGALAMLFLAWFSGISIGMLVLALKPWAPMPATMIQNIYRRANMIASGKMVVANSLPAYMLAMFSWNPLFHIIDQARGYMFINYNPHKTSIEYPLILSLILLTIGLMGEFYTRKHASVSWGARR